MYASILSSVNFDPSSPRWLLITLILTQKAVFFDDELVSDYIDGGVDGGVHLLPGRRRDLRTSTGLLSYSSGLLTKILNVEFFIPYFHNITRKIADK